MTKLKSLVKRQLLTYAKRYVGKQALLNELLFPVEKEAIKHIKHGFLRDTGWWKSWEAKAPVDFENNPLPWVTYSFINFIENRLNKDMVLFEFGSGNSTLYYSSKVKEVHTVEHDSEWFKKISQNLPENVTIENIELEYGGKYSCASQNKEVKYDVIIVDGRDRVNSMINSIDSLKENGVIILDDSERASYQIGIEKLIHSGFKVLDFWGISPGFLAYNKSTSIYYRNKNILGI